MKKNLLILFLVGPLLWGCSKQAIVEEGSEAQGVLAGRKVPNLAKKTVTVQRADYNQIFTIPCANNGNGEQVSIVGTSELTIETSLSGYITTTTMEFEILNAKGTGSITGTTYTAVGGYTAITISSSRDSRYNYSFNEQVNVTAPGSNNDLIYKLTATQSTGPKGNVTKDYDVVETNDCN
jgi:hypothetical protein